MSNVFREESASLPMTVTTASLNYADLSQALFSPEYDKLLSEWTGSPYNNASHGGCLVVAQALHQIYGGELDAVTFGGGHTMVQHYVVKIGPDEYLDAYGPHSAAEIYETWCYGHGEIRPATQEVIADAPYIWSSPEAVQGTVAFLTGHKTAVMDSTVPLYSAALPLPGEDLAREFSISPGIDEYAAEDMNALSRAYRDMPIVNPRAIGAWKKLGTLVTEQANELRQVFDIRIVPYDPYVTAADMLADITKGIYKVPTLHSHHPVWDVDTNVNFRISHDILGHFGANSDFSFHGEIMAYRSECEHTPEDLWPVLFTEIIAQAAYANVHHLFGEQKVGLIGLTPDEMEALVGKVLDAPDPAYDAMHYSACLSYRQRPAKTRHTPAMDTTVATRRVLGEDIPPLTPDAVPTLDNQAPEKPMPFEWTDDSDTGVMSSLKNLWDAGLTLFANKKTATLIVGDVMTLDKPVDQAKSDAVKNEKRAPDGKWTKGPGGSAPSPTPSPPPADDSLTTQKLDKQDDQAVQRDVSEVGKGDDVTMPEKNVPFLLEDLLKVTDKMKAAGENAPTYDLCKITVPGTNLFCQGNEQIPRSDMPQLIAGDPIPGSPASKLTPNARGDYDIGPLFRQELTKRGIKWDQENVDPMSLSASQNNLNGAKVALLAKVTEEGKMDLSSPLWVSQDGYIVDGHHRWAGIVAAEMAENKDFKIPVIRVDMPIKPLLKLANQFGHDMGIPQAGMNNGFAADFEAGSPNAGDVKPAPMRVEPVISDPTTFRGKPIAIDLTLKTLPPDVAQTVTDRFTQSLGVKPQEATHNLVKLFEAAPADLRDEYAKWYNVTHDLSRTLGQKNNIDPHVCAAIIACSSAGASWTSKKGNQDVAATILEECNPQNRVEPIDDSIRKWVNVRLVAPRERTNKKTGEVTQLGPLTSYQIPQGASLDDVWKAIGKETADTQNKILGMVVGKAQGFPVGYGYGNYGKAIDMALTNDPSTITSTIAGPKIRSFFNNIENPDDDKDVTVDIHMWRSFVNDQTLSSEELGKRFALVKANSSKLTSNPSWSGASLGAYPQGADVVRAATAQINADQGAHFTPAQVQAVVWGEQRTSWGMGRIRKIQMSANQDNVPVPANQDKPMRIPVYWGTDPDDEEEEEKFLLPGGAKEAALDASLGSQVQANLTDDLRLGHYKGNPNPLAGHCYVASEAYYHMAGGKEAGLKPMFIRHEGEPHWFLRDRDGSNIDLTAGQFQTPVPYDQARGKGFLTAQPSKRAQVVIDRLRTSKTGAVHSGEMIAALVPHEVRQYLKQFGPAEANNFHITLAYMPNPAVHETISRITLGLALSQTPIEARLGGFAQFETEDGYVLVALVDSPGLQEFQRVVADCLVANHIDMSHDHAFTAHITLSYSDTPFSALPHLDDDVPDPFTITGLIYSDVDDHWELYALAMAIDDADQWATPFNPKASSNLWAADEEWAHHATYDPDPEPALPYTDGEVAQDVGPEDQDGGEDAEHITSAASIEQLQKGMAWLQAGGSSSTHGQDDMNIASAAQAHLQSQGVKTFSPAEQSELINEGENARAANLDRLQLEGTHYEQLEAALQEAEANNDPVYWWL